VERPDGLTEQFRNMSDAWRSTVGQTDAALAEQIRADGIDILVDLKLHTENNHLLAFARRAAPLQVTWLGYPGTTGLRAIDYRLSDPHLDPPAVDETVYAERTVRLPHTFWCYDPLAAGPAVSELPALMNGVVTFGCFNNFCKVSAPTLALWAAVMDAVPRSRLLLQAPHGSPRGRVADALRSCGVAPERVEFLPIVSRAEYLALYHRIDVVLDTLPYNGHTTSLDAMWMGVPVVTLVGQTIVGRAGASQLMNLGMPELIARAPAEFVEAAVGLAGDLPRLAGLRAALRPRMQASPLMDAPRFARDIEAAYRQMWHARCA
jgi:protein O-GlcNAc transferase